MANINMILQFRKTVQQLRNKGRTLTSIRKETKLSSKAFNGVLEGNIGSIVIYASTKAKIQDFNKKYVDLLNPMLEDLTSISKEDLTAADVKPIPIPTDEDLIHPEDKLEEKAEIQKKMSIEDFMRRLTELCEDHQPPNIEVTITIK